MIRKKTKVPSPARRRNTEFLQLIGFLWANIPDYCPGHQKLIPYPAKSMVQRMAVAVGFPGNAYAFFSWTCYQLRESGKDIEKEIAARFSCFHGNLFSPGALYQRFPESRNRFKRKRPYFCRKCRAWMFSRALSGLEEPGNRMGYSSHWVCPVCLDEIYSLTPIDRFGFPV